MIEVQTNVIKLSPEKTLWVEPINGRSLLINTSSVAFLDIQMDDNGDHIQAIVLEDKHTLRIGDKFSIEIGTVDSIYEIMYMVVAKEGKSILLFSSTPNKTTNFLLPVLGKSKTELKFETYFVNAFIDDEGKHISVLYRFTGTEAFKEFEQTMMSDAKYVTHKDYDTYHVMYIFRIPEKFEMDVFSFKEGRYSLFSKALRQRILKFYGGEDSAVILQIVRQDKGLKEKLEKHLGVKLPEDAELASKPELKNEIFNI